MFVAKSLLVAVEMLVELKLLNPDVYCEIVCLLLLRGLLEMSFVVVAVSRNVPWDPLFVKNENTGITLAQLNLFTKLITNGYVIFVLFYNYC